MSRLIRALNSVPEPGYRVVAACCSDAGEGLIEQVPVVGHPRLSSISPEESCPELLSGSGGDRFVAPVAGVSRISGAGWTRRVA